MARSTTEQRAADLVAAKPWLELDWSSNGPYGAAQKLNPPRPCVICEQPAYLLSPRKAAPAHKTCVEQYYLVGLLGGILVGLGQTSSAGPLKPPTPAPPAAADQPEDATAPTHCRICGNRLLLVRAGRDTCARDHA